MSNRVELLERHGFGVDHVRRLDGVIRDLAANRSWIDLTEEGAQQTHPIDTMQTTVVGTLTLNGDRIAVIGSSAPATEEVRVNIRSRGSKEEGLAKWSEDRVDRDAFRRLKAQGPDEEAVLNLNEYLDHTYRRFESRPPTVFLTYLPACDGVRAYAGYWADLWLPETILVELAADVRERHCETLSVRIQLMPTIVSDPWARPLDHVTFGLLPASSIDNESARGWVEALSWSPSCPRDLQKEPPDAAARNNDSVPD